MSNFEGPEKVLELWFAPVDSDANDKKTAPEKGLRAIERKVWEKMLNLVKCQVISTIGNEHLDAYLLSESSMFVYPRQLVLKTCGTTTLLEAVPELLKIAKSVGLAVQDVFYNRQNFFFPDKQLHPHRSFSDEVKVLDSYFRNGSAYVVGKVNGNHWNFYNAEKKQILSEINKVEDVTFEMLLTGLNPKLMKPFYFNPQMTSKEATSRSKIDLLFPGAKIDDFIFEPYGYSMNGLLGDGYFTIHITPQENCSFASFETNIVLEDYTDLALKILKVFHPKRFILTLMGNRASLSKLKKVRDENDYGKSGLDAKRLCNLGFRIDDDILLKFEHYDLVFLQLCENDKSVAKKTTVNAKQCAKCTNMST
eukprot:CAMPEP_0114500392 /NCGR_PEP_ID=MMETSP0109-20121206/7938_1 /TAXON_ID=29199 /ORGANISM="Chlorarachnion reptans, Strain CCCM449" /LENGTH=364 /DNA_ID=CAMNT_0001678047 /DNA_START=255 /DNA_END=1349 /DNA_ORIENTATION=+